MKKKNYIIILIFLIIIIKILSDNIIIKNTHYSINSEKIPKKMDGYKIIQISDLHNTNRYKKIAQMVNDENPDIVVITGDLIDANRTNIDNAIGFIEMVNQTPIYYVTGNHEAWSDKYEDLKKRLEDNGVIILDNSSIDLINGVCLSGLADPDFANTDAEGSAILDYYLDNMDLDNRKFNILLSHRPEVFDVYCEHDIDLVLAGHAHGGQFIIPFIGGVIAPNQGIFPKYYKGIYMDSHTKMIVSAGLGNSIIPIRINNPSEIIVISLYNEK